jgi:hypothetical protein
MTKFFAFATEILYMIFIETANTNHRFVTSMHLYFLFVKALRQLRQI